MKVPKPPVWCTEGEKIVEPEKWKKANFTLYTKVSEPVPLGKAYLCARKMQTVQFYTNLLSDPIKPENVLTNISSTTIEDCRRFIETRKCEQGSLNNHVGNLFETNQALDLTYPSAWHSFWHGATKANATNCLLEETELYFNAHTLRLYSLVHEVKHCSYNNRSCVVPTKEGTMLLLWTAATRLRPFDYKFSKATSGIFSERMLISDDHQLALTFPTSPESSFDQHGIPLIISEQHLAIKQTEFQSMQNHQRLTTNGKQKREASTTEEMAAELTAEEIRRVQSMASIAKQVCPHIVSSKQDATLVARQMTRRIDVMAKWRTSDILEVYQCAQLNTSQVCFRKTKNCTLYIPVYASLSHFERIEAFIDPVLRILSRTSPLADCSIHDRHYWETSKGLIEFNFITGLERIVPEMEIGHPTLEQAQQTFKVEAFHDYVLSNEVSNVVSK